MGDPEWARDRRYETVAGRLEHVDSLDQAIGEWTAGHAAASLMERLQSAGVEAGVVQGCTELLEDPQLATREHFVALEHEPLGELLFERSGFRLSETPGRLDRPGPRLGEHEHAVLGGILGLESAEIERLIEQGIAV
jgi:crotonobetainyl-CoA:carnitine CoA-transferase CaiB-like acyl-CoA transferase